jgi:hypothetical protein
MNPFNLPSADQPVGFPHLKTDSGDSRQGGGDGESRGKNDCPPESISKIHFIAAAHQKAIGAATLKL